MSDRSCRAAARSDAIAGERANALTTWRSLGGLAGTLVASAATSRGPNPGPVEFFLLDEAGVRKPALFPCFRRKSGYIPRHLTRKHGFKGRPVATGPTRLVCSHVSGGTNRRTDYHGATRFLYASAARSWRSLWS